eukprot:1554427-Prymnesium_polylepis.1
MRPRKWRSVDSRLHPGRPPARSWAPPALGRLRSSQPSADIPADRNVQWATAPPIRKIGWQTAVPPPAARRAAAAHLMDRVP